MGNILIRAMGKLFRLLGKIDKRLGSLLGTADGILSVVLSIVVKLFDLSARAYALYWLVSSAGGFLILHL